MLQCMYYLMHLRRCDERYYAHPTDSELVKWRSRRLFLMDPLLLDYK